MLREGATPRTSASAAIGAYVLALQFFFQNTLYASDLGMSDFAMKEAILKIDVTFGKSKIDSGGNQICKSEGTGFVISSNHVVTAKHVFDFDPDCGPPTILAKSFANGAQIILKTLDTENDLALLKSETSLTDGYADTANNLRKFPCAISVSNVDNVFEQGGAVRYGIPGGLMEPTLIATVIGSADGQFGRLIAVTPIRIEKGESGGPIMKDFVVVGVTEARIENAQMIGLMNRSSELYRLLSRNQAHTMQLSDSCHPALYKKRQTLALVNSIKVNTFTQNGDVFARVAYDPNAIEDEGYLNLVLNSTQSELLTQVGRALPTGYNVAPANSPPGDLLYKVELPKTQTQRICNVVLGGLLNCRTTTIALSKNAIDLQAARISQALESKKITGDVQAKLNAKLEMNVEDIEFGFDQNRPPFQ